MKDIINYIKKYVKMNIYVYLIMKCSYLLFIFLFCKFKFMNYENIIYNDIYILNVLNIFIFYFYLGVFIIKGDVGVGMIVGFVVFNIFVVIGLCGILVGEVYR